MAFISFATNGEFFSKRYGWRSTESIIIEMKNFTLCCLGCILNFLVLFDLNAQRLDYIEPDAPYHVFEPNECSSVNLVAKAVISTRSSATLYLRFENSLVEGFVYLKTSKSETPATYLTNSSNELIVNDLPLDNVCTVWAKNDCGDLVELYRFQTTQAEEPQLEVSDAFYDQIRRYQTEELPSTLHKYLTMDWPNVSNYEKVAFIQQFYYKGQPLPKWDLTALAPIPDLSSRNSECECRFIFKSTQTITPFGGFNSTNTAYIAEGLSTPKADLDISDAAFWTDRFNKGPAKWHAIQTEGYNAGTGTHQITREWPLTNGQTSNTGQHFARLAYNLVCENFAEGVPERCECDKPVRFFYNYDSQVEAKANIAQASWLQSWGSKQSFAIAQDAVNVLFYRGGEGAPVLVRNSSLAAESTCAVSPNPDFFVAVGNLTLNAAEITLALLDSDITVIDTIAFNEGINNIANSLSDVISTPIYSSNSCASALHSANLVNGDTTIYINPNQEVVMYLSSFSKLNSGGKRAWYSKAEVISDFYLFGYVPGGYLEHPDEQHCCSKHMVNWVTASMFNNPNTSEKNRVYCTMSRSVRLFGRLILTLPAHWSCRFSLNKPCFGLLRASTGFI
jgi:hypothetical protein